MLDHVGLTVSDWDASRAFYEQALAPLGITLLMEFGRSGGFGHDGMPFFWIREEEPAARVHVAFHCEERGSVDAFHAAALAAGGTDNGAPGLREHYHPTYYAAFALDPDGNNVEAVCHAPA